MLPDAVQVADPFHVVKLANKSVDDTRRRVQNETLGHRGHANDPLYRSRRLLTGPMNASPRNTTRNSSDSSKPATRKAKSAWHGTRKLGRTIVRWSAQIAAWHRAHLSNGPTEAVKKSDQARRVRVHQLRALPDPSLLDAGGPNWDLLATITAR